jgi:hypothetical protein
MAPGAGGEPRDGRVGAGGTPRQGPSVRPSAARDRLGSHPNHSSPIHHGSITDPQRIHNRPSRPLWCLHRSHPDQTAPNGGRIPTQRVPGPTIRHRSVTDPQPIHNRCITDRHGRCGAPTDHNQTQPQPTVDAHPARHPPTCRLALTWEGSRAACQLSAACSWTGRLLHATIVGETGVGGPDSMRGLPPVGGWMFAPPA